MSTGPRGEKPRQPPTADEEATGELAVSEALAALLALAASLEELELEGVEPAYGYPRWQ